MFFVALAAGGAAAFLGDSAEGKRLALALITQIPNVDVRVATGGMDNSSDRRTEFNTAWFEVGANT